MPLTASTCPADSIGSRTAAPIFSSLSLLASKPMRREIAGHIRIAEVALGDAERLALQIGHAVDAAAAPRDDRVAVVVVQDEHRLQRCGAVVAVADQVVEVDQRDVAVALGEAREGLARGGDRVGRDFEVLGTIEPAARGERERDGGAVDPTVERETDDRRGMRGRREGAEMRKQAEGCKEQRVSLGGRLNTHGTHVEKRGADSAALRGFRHKITGLRRARPRMYRMLR